MFSPHPHEIAFAQAVLCCSLLLTARTVRAAEKNQAPGIGKTEKSHVDVDFVEQPTAVASWSETIANSSGGQDSDALSWHRIED